MCKEIFKNDIFKWHKNCYPVLRQPLRPKQKQVFLVHVIVCSESGFIKKDEHTFLERGHTVNEKDPMYSAIETALKHRLVYKTSQLATVIDGARRAKPYCVTVMMKMISLISNI